MRTLNYKEFARQVADPATGTAVSPVLDAVDALPARLVWVQPTGEFVGRTYELPNGAMRIGRTEDCDVLLPDATVSRQHARLEPPQGGVYALTDLGSSNGTFVNGVRVRSADVRSGDRVQFGNAVLLYLAAGA